jgi:predicted nucleotidyltransferase
VACLGSVRAGYQVIGEKIPIVNVRTERLTRRHRRGYTDQTLGPKPEWSSTKDDNADRTRQNFAN